MLGNLFQKHEIKVIGVNTIRCPDKELEYRVLYRKAIIPASNLREGVREKLEASGIAVVKESNDGMFTAFVLTIHRFNQLLMVIN